MIGPCQHCPPRALPPLPLSPSTLENLATIHLQGGRKEKIRAGDVLGALTADVGHAREQVGRIDINEFATCVAVQRGIGREPVARLNAGRIKARSVKARVLED